MPVIRVSDLTWQRLKNYAVPFEDTPERVIIRALDALDSLNRAGRAHAPASASVGDATKKPARHRAGGKLPQKEFRIPLIEAVYELGGKATTDRVRKIMEKKMAPRLGPAEHEKVSSGDPRWWNAICWERHDLVKQGLFRKDSPRGTWALTEEGVKFVESRRSR